MSSWLSNLGQAASRVKPLHQRLPSHDLLVHQGEAEGDGDGEEGGLRRRLGVFDLILLGIGASIGAGIFVVTGAVALDTGPGVTASFVLAGIACVANALCYAELSSHFPAVVGGAYLYAYSAFSELIAFMVWCQLMVDYHIGAASITRSLAGYLVSILELIPFLKGRIPLWLGPGGMELLNGFFSINILATLLLLIITWVLCRGIRESAAVNAVMTLTKVAIVVAVIAVGSFEVDTSNWTPFAPFGVTSIVTGATVVFFAYVGFDAVANSAEECKRPKRDLPIGIIVSLAACAVLYVGVCLVLTGMVPYQELSGDAPLAIAFTNRGLKYMTALISVGAVAGLTTTVLVGMYVQSRLYLGVGRDGLLPALFARIHPEHHTPLNAQIWCGGVAGVLATFFNVSHLSHILSVGTLSGYSIVCASVIILRMKNEESQSSWKGITLLSRRQEAIACLLCVTLCSFVAGLFFRYSAYFLYPLAFVAVSLLFAIPLYTRQAYEKHSGFSCPGSPFIPMLGILVNVFLFAQLHWEGWVRFVVLGMLSVLFYAFYGQHHANQEFLIPRGSTHYDRASSTEDDDSRNV